MYMVCSHVNGLQMPFSNATCLANSLLNRSSFSCSEDEWIGFKLFAIVVLPSFVPIQIGIAIAIVKAIYGSAFVAM